MFLCRNQNIQKDNLNNTLRDILQDKHSVDASSIYHSQQHADVSAFQSALGSVEPHLVSTFCLVASWSMAIGSYSKLVKSLLQKYDGYLCKVLPQSPLKHLFVH